MREKFQNLGTREKRMVIVGGIVVLIVLFYTFVWSPFFTALSTLQASFQQETSLITWMQSTGSRLGALRAEGFSVSTMQNVPFLTQVNTAFNNAGLSHYFLQPPVLKEKTVTFVMGDVPFDLFSKVLDQLWKQSNIVVSNIKVVQRPIPGTVNAAVTLVQNS